MAGVEISAVEIAGLELTASQVQQILLVLFGFLIFSLIVVLYNLIAKNRGSSAGEKPSKKSGKKPGKKQEKKEPVCHDICYNHNTVLLI